MFKIDNTPLKIFIPFFISFISLSFADIVTTKIALFFGGVEANPFVGSLISSLSIDGTAVYKISMAIFLVVATIIYLYKIQKNSPAKFSLYRKVALGVWVCLVGSLSFVVANNSFIIFLGLT